MRGFEETTPKPTLVHQRGERLVVIQDVGAGMASSWGYTIWHEGRCVAGACHWEWTRDDAALAALATVAVMES
jgi:hypothetical protein